MNFEHVDRASVKKLVNIQELQDGHYVAKQVQWNPFALKTVLKEHFLSIPFFEVSDAEYFVAGKAIDDFVYENYDPETVEKWEKSDDPPATLEADMLAKYPNTFRPYIETISKKLQNKYCKYFKLKAELPQYPGLKIFLWSGHETKGPFVVNRNIYYNMVILRGRVRDIDAFLKDFGV